MYRHLARLLIVGAILTLVTTPAVGESTESTVPRPMPAFGPSITIDPDGPRFDMASLRGKAVLVIFMQSWCGACNGWSKALIPQLEATYGIEDGWVLLAIKTDGGGVSGAKDYLRNQGGNPDRWLIAADHDAVWYRQITGDNQLWRYALVTADGTLTYVHRSGLIISNSNPRTFLIAHKKREFERQVGQRRALLPAEGRYGVALAPVVLRAEVGDLPGAFRMLQQAGQSDAATRLRSDLDTMLNERCAALMAEARSAADPSARMPPLVSLLAFIAGIERHPGLAEVTAFIQEQRRDQSMRREFQAWDQWQ